ncbi:MAG: hypothetical protein P4L31_07345 [Candidatus Babeliales bacterium]|nr:hypothetical protein [Candidatus Babeliales bacterium]
MEATINQVIDYTVKQFRKDNSMFKATIKAVVIEVGVFIKCRPIENCIDTVTGVEIIGLNDIININPDFFIY